MEIINNNNKRVEETTFLEVASVFALCILFCYLITFIPDNNKKPPTPQRVNPILNSNSVKSCVIDTNLVDFGESAIDTFTNFTYEWHQCDVISNTKNGESVPININYGDPVFYDDNWPDYYKYLRNHTNN